MSVRSLITLEYFAELSSSSGHFQLTGSKIKTKTGNQAPLADRKADEHIRRVLWQQVICRVRIVCKQVYTAHI